MYNVENIEETFHASLMELAEFQKSHEQKVIEAYRNHPEMQQAINKILDIDEEK